MADSEQPAPSKSRAGRDLPAAIAVGLALFGIVVATLVWWPPGFIVLLVVLTSLGAVEVHHALQRVGMTSVVLPVVHRQRHHHRRFVRRRRAAAGHADPLARRAAGDDRWQRAARADVADVQGRRGLRP